MRGDHAELLIDGESETWLYSRNQGDRGFDKLEMLLRLSDKLGSATLRRAAETFLMSDENCRKISLSPLHRLFLADKYRLSVPCSRVMGKLTKREYEKMRRDPTNHKFLELSLPLLASLETKFSVRPSQQLQQVQQGEGAVVEEETNETEPAADSSLPSPSTARSTCRVVRTAPSAPVAPTASHSRSRSSHNENSVAIGCKKIPQTAG
ncbi:hypothetical protein PFISCL1PPCAC_29082 [Pristionchus fissidentatus]|uniref:Uncharacterized protein n=1 Tax=Pristionchus fissidentatus TaxID=1538716 RepID=A0AAV5X3I8_9BILA|nr:hypothetical protein PFISCL1PPCAC_29082 [Pristionchus fissidentatus]